MVKNDAITGQDSLLVEGIKRTVTLGRSDSRRDSPQSVTISEEGKKKQILGQLMSGFFNADKGRSRVDR
jgi:hypothetical protein